MHSREDWFNQRLQDGGPVYAETDPGRFIVEPWNAASSLLILIPAIYWLWRIRSNYSGYKFLVFAIPLVIAGGLGSALFHGFRVSVIFLVMDVLPSALLTLSISIYLWINIFRRWWYVLFVIIPVSALRFASFRYLEGSLAINFSYLITGIMAGLPLVIILYRTDFYKVTYAALGIGFFLLALLARTLDSQLNEFLPMGSHFLWHTFSAAGAYFVLGYLYFFRNRKSSEGQLIASTQQ